MEVVKQEMSTRSKLLIQKYLQKIKDTGLLLVPSSKLKRLANEKYINEQLKDELC